MHTERVADAASAAEFTKFFEKETVVEVAVLLVLYFAEKGLKIMAIIIDEIINNEKNK